MDDDTQRQDQDEPIQSFSDTPPTKANKSITPDRIHQAEEETKEQEEEDAGTDDNDATSDDGVQLDEPSTDVEEDTTTEDEDGSEDQPLDELYWYTDVYNLPLYPRKHGRRLTEEERIQRHVSSLRSDALRVSSLAHAWDTLEYGNPSHTDFTPGSGCPNCGNQDAGDVVILDNDVEEDTNDNTDDSGISEDIGLTDNDNISEDNSDISSLQSDALRVSLHYRQDILTYDKYRTALEECYIATSTSVYPSWMVGNEDFWEAIEGLVSALKTVMVKVAKYARRTYLFVRNKISRIFMRLTTIQSIWNTKISMNLANIRSSDLDTLQVRSLPFQLWVDSAKLSVMCYDLVARGDSIVFDNSDHTITKVMSEIKQQMKRCSIDMDISEGKLKLDDLTDQRQQGTLSELGWNRNHIAIALRHLGDLATRVPNDKDAPLEKKTNALIEKLTAYSREINDKVESGSLPKGSKAYRDAADTLLERTIRFDFVLACSRCSYALFDMLTNDFLDVLEEVEDSYDPEGIVH